MKTNQRNYIDPLASDIEKSSDDYGLKVAKEIASFWFNGGMLTNDCTYAKRRDWIRSMRKYSRGEQDLSHYKGLISGEKGDNLTFHNLDWRPDKTAGKFVYVVANGIDDKHYRLNVIANDRLSSDEKVEYRKELKNEMYNRDLVRLAKEMLGVDVGTTAYVPDSEEDLEIHMETKYKPKQEIANELLIQTVFDYNEWRDIVEGYTKDLVESGLGVVECYTDNLNGITLRLVDIENYVHSYVKNNNFSDKTYEGVVRTVAVSELQSEGGFSDGEMREIIKMYASKNGLSAIELRSTNFSITNYLDLKIDILDFTHKTSKRRAYKKKYNDKGGFKMVGKSSDYSIRKTKKSESVAKTVNTWYEGSYILGSEIVYNYRESNHIVKDSLGRARSRFIARATNIYENRLHSFLSDIVPALDQLHITKLKLQHVIAEIKPQGAEIDIDMVVSLTQGDKIDYKEIIRLFTAKGIVFKKRISDEFGNIKEGRAVEELQNGIPGNLLHLLNVLQHQYETLREITGINPSRDGTQRHDMLVGVNEAQIIASNTITNHISKAAIKLKLDVAEVISLRISDIFRFKHKAPHLVKMYERAIGKLNVDVLESMKGIHLYSFGFSMEMLPTMQELQNFEESMRISLEAGRITEDDMNEAREIAKKNPKLANQYLRIRRKKKQEEDLAIQEQQARIKSESDIASATAASQNRIQEKAAEGEIMVEVEKAKAMIEVEKQAMLNQVNEPVRREGYDVDIFKKQLEVAAAMDLNRFKEDEKTRRQNKNNTDHSKMIDQRKRDLPPIDFNRDAEFDDILEGLLS